MEIHHQYQKIVPFILFTLALVLLFLLVRPMITILLSSILLAYLSFPLYRIINKRIHLQSISIILSLFIILVIVLIPFTFLAVEITKQAFYFHNSLSIGISKGALFGFGCTSAESGVCSLINQAEKFSLERLSGFGFDQQLQEFILILEHKIALFILNIPFFVAEIFLVLVLAYFILKDWKNMLNKIADLLPMKKKTICQLIQKFRDITQTVIYAQLFVALVQGIVATIGFYIFGVPFPIILGVVTAFCALIPSIGTALIWIPASLFLILSGYFSHNYWIFGKGIGLFLYGILVVSTIDNILLAKIVHAKAHVNQIVVIVGVIGGAALFGVVGIFLGPVLLPLLITYFQTFRERFR